MGHIRDQFTFIVHNNCPYALDVAYVGYTDIKNYQTIQSGMDFVGGGLVNRQGNTYDEGEKYFLSDPIDKIHILYPDGHEDVLTLQDFVTKAATQMGARAKGEWMLSLCPGQK